MRPNRLREIWAQGGAAVNGWLHFRGPHQNGTSAETGLPAQLSLTDGSLLWTAPLAGQSTAVVADAEQDDDANIAFDRMTEEDLLAGIEGLVPPEKNDDY